MDSFGFSVLLVLATGGVSLLIAWQQNRFAVQRAAIERAAAVQDRLREVSRKHELALHRALNDIVQIAIDAGSEDGSLPPRDSYKEPVAIARRQYLLIADADVRAAIADGLTVVANPVMRGVSLGDWQEAAATASFVMAAHLRGEELPLNYVERLKELRAEYAVEE